MILAMDEFLLNWTLQELQKQIDTNKLAADTYFSENTENTGALDERVDGLELSEQNTSGVINSLKEMLDDLKAELSDTRAELNKTKLVNIKQEIRVRTLHNLQAFSAHDMFVDTFVDGANLNWDRSIRCEFFPDLQAVGRTGKSTVILEQTSVPTALLISQNGTSDQGVSQSFYVDKNRRLDKVQLHVSKYNASSFRPLKVAIRGGITGPVLTSTEVSASNITGGWVDIVVPEYLLVTDVEYYLEVTTEDTYGYKIGMDSSDQYLAGTSFNLYSNNWLDNNHDIGFKIFCFPAEDEQDGILYTNAQFVSSPVSIIFEREETVENGGINYYVSRNGGADWKLLQPAVETDLNDLPEGNEIVLRANLLGGSRIEAWGYVIKRGETA